MPKFQSSLRGEVLLRHVEERSTHINFKLRLLSFNDPRIVDHCPITLLAHNDLAQAKKVIAHKGEKEKKVSLFPEKNIFIFVFLRQDKNHTNFGTLERRLALFCTAPCGCVCPTRADPCGIGHAPGSNRHHTSRCLGCGERVQGKSFGRGLI